MEERWDFEDGLVGTKHPTLATQSGIWTVTDEQAHSLQKSYQQTETGAGVKYCFGGSPKTDSFIEAWIMTDPNNPAGGGVCLRRESWNNYYYVEASPSTGEFTLITVVDGVEILLDEVLFQIPYGQWHKIRLEASDEGATVRLRGYWDNQLRINYLESQRSHSIGMFMLASNGIDWFDDVRYGDLAVQPSMLPILLLGGFGVVALIGFVWWLSKTK